MALFASLCPYLIPSLHAQCLSCSTPLPFLVAGVCLEGQSGASCFTSCAASSPSHIGANCSNNNTTGAQARSSGSPETERRRTSQSQLDSEGTVWRETGRKVPTAVQQKRTSEQKSPREKTERGRKTNYMRYRNWQ